MHYPKTYVSQQNLADIQIYEIQLNIMITLS